MTMNKESGKQRYERVMKEVQNNRAKLDSCRRHSFERVTNGTLTISQSYECTKCGGVVSGQEYRWYEMGIHHGRRDVLQHEPGGIAPHNLLP